MRVGSRSCAGASACISGDHVGCAAIGADVIERDDVGVIERRGRAGLLLEARDPIRVGGHALRQNLDRNVPMEAGVVRAIHLAHAANTQDG